MRSTTRPYSITFRLGSREYEELVKAVSTHGSRSVSEFTRMAVINSIVAANVNDFLDTEFNGLVSHLEAFDAKLRELRRNMRQLLITADVLGE